MLSHDALNILLLWYLYQNKSLVYVYTCTWRKYSNVHTHARNLGVIFHSALKYDVFWRSGNHLACFYLFNQSINQAFISSHLDYCSSQILRFFQFSQSLTPHHFTFLVQVQRWLSVFSCCPLTVELFILHCSLSNLLRLTCFSVAFECPYDSKMALFCLLQSFTHLFCF